MGCERGCSELGILAGMVGRVGAVYSGGRFRNCCVGTVYLFGRFWVLKNQFMAMKWLSKTSVLYD